MLISVSSQENGAFGGARRADATFGRALAKAVVERAAALLRSFVPFCSTAYAPEGSLLGAAVNACDGRVMPGRRRYRGRNEA